MTLIGSRSKLGYLHKSAGVSCFLGIQPGFIDKPNDLYAFFAASRVSNANRGISLFYDDRIAFDIEDKLRLMINSGSGVSPFDMYPAGENNTLRAGAPAVIGFAHGESQSPNGSVYVGERRTFSSNYERQPSTIDTTNYDYQLFADGGGSFRAKGRFYGGAAFDRVLNTVEMIALVRHFEDKF